MKIIEWLTGIAISGLLALSAVAQDQPLPPAPNNGVTPEISEVPATNSTVRPRDALDAYEQQMAFVTMQTYAELAHVAEGVRTGQMSGHEAEHLTRRAYELGLMRLQFLDTMHQIVQSDLDKESAPAKLEQQEPEDQTAEETIVVVPPTSPDIPESVVKFLELTPAQIAAIQAHISNESRHLQAMVQQLSQNQKALSGALRGTQANDNHIKKLAVERSHILERLIVANSRLERTIYEVLTPVQRQKLDQMEQGGPDVMTRLFAQR